MGSLISWLSDIGNHELLHLDNRVLAILQLGDQAIVAGGQGIIGTKLEIQFLARHDPASEASGDAHALSGFRFNG